MKKQFMQEIEYTIQKIKNELDIFNNLKNSDELHVYDLNRLITVSLILKEINEGLN